MKIDRIIKIIKITNLLMIGLKQNSALSFFLFAQKVFDKYFIYFILFIYFLFFLTFFISLIASIF